MGLRGGSSKSKGRHSKQRTSMHYAQKSMGRWAPCSLSWKDARSAVDVRRRTPLEGWGSVIVVIMIMGVVMWMMRGMRVMMMVVIMVIVMMTLTVSPVVDTITPAGCFSGPCKKHLVPTQADSSRNLGDALNHFGSAAPSLAAGLDERGARMFRILGLLC